MSILDKQFTPRPKRRSRRRLYIIPGIVVILVAALFLFTNVGNDVAFVGHFVTPPQHFTYSGQSDYISAVAWSRDGKRIASASGDHTAQVWDAGNGGHVLTYRGHSADVLALAWSPNGQYIATGSLDNTVQVWNPINGATLYTYRGHSDAIFDLAWSPDSKRIVTQYDSPNAQPAPTSLQVWDAQTGKTLFTFGDATTIQVAWSPDGNRIASVSTDYNVNLFNASNGGLLQSYPIHGDSSADSFWPVQLLWSPDSRYLALDNSDYTIQIWDTRNDATGNFPARTGRSRTMLWQPDDQLFIIDASQNTRIIDPGGI